MFLAVFFCYVGEIQQIYMIALKHHVFFEALANGLITPKDATVRKTNKSIKLHDRESFAGSFTNL